MNSIKPSDIHEGRFEIAPNLFAIVSTEQEDSNEAPWENCDGHGPVSDWERRDKHAGEWVLSSDRGGFKRYYDACEAIKIAKRDGWDCAPYHAAFPNETKGQQASRAVQSDFNYIKGWCNDEWSFITVMVKLEDADKNEIATDSLGMVESLGNYWKECASEMINTLAEAHEKETAERAYWEAREVETL